MIENIIFYYTMTLMVIMGGAILMAYKHTVISLAIFAGVLVLVQIFLWDLTGRAKPVFYLKEDVQLISATVGEEKKYFYYAGTYRYEQMGGTGRLVPFTKIDPVATLIPQ